MAAGKLRHEVSHMRVPLHARKDERQNDAKGAQRREVTAFRDIIRVGYCPEVLP